MKVVSWTIRKHRGQRADYVLTLQCGHQVERHCDKPPLSTQCEKCKAELPVGAQEEKK